MCWGLKIGPARAVDFFSLLRFGIWDGHGAALGEQKQKQKDKREPETGPETGNPGRSALPGKDAGPQDIRKRELKRDPKRGAERPWPGIFSSSFLYARTCWPPGSRPTSQPAGIFGESASCPLVKQSCCCKSLEQETTTNNKKTNKNRQTTKNTNKTTKHKKT